MRLLLACEYYHPSRGGVQEVMRQIAERLVAMGHEVTVATTRLPERDFKVLNGVRIEEFDIRGNRATGLKGETDRYERFLTGLDVDAILIKAAQQWTFDATWPVLDRIKARKVFIPCGFSGFFLPQYQPYFRDMPEFLAKFDRLIFYAERYRDIDFARQHGLTDKITILPNGASDIEFAVPRDARFREALGIGADELVLLTVGTPINAKGHTEVAAAFSLLDTKGRPATLILNGQWPSPPPPPDAAPLPESRIVQNAAPTAVARIQALSDRAMNVFRREGGLAFAGRATLSIGYRTLGAARAAGQLGVRGLQHGRYRAAQLIHTLRPAASPPEPPPPPPKSIEDWVALAVAQPGKRVLKTHLSRRDTIQAFLSADLFVFASNIEYSPLVLFESAAAGLPFLTVPVGNAEEIVQWTGGGQVCPAPKDELGFTRVEPMILGDHIRRLLEDEALRHRLGARGREAWRRQFNWGAIARRYEAVLAGDEAASSAGVVQSLEMMNGDSASPPS